MLNSIRQSEVLLILVLEKKIVSSSKQSQSKSIKVKQKVANASIAFISKFQFLHMILHQYTKDEKSVVSGSGHG